jgi:RimJ/RimL family protein N-acetyltransferase
MPAPHRPAPAPRALQIRAITAEDSARVADAFAGFSDRTRYLRFLGPKPRLSAAELRYLTDVDQHTHVALAAVDPHDGSFVGIARYATEAGETESADVAVVIADVWQGAGVGTLLMRELVARAAANGIARLTGTTLHDNPAARALLRRVGFRTRSIGGGLIELELELRAEAQAA